jgi:hypothetical protein
MGSSGQIDAGFLRGRQDWRCQFGGVRSVSHRFLSLSLQRSPFLKNKGVNQQATQPRTFIKVEYALIKLSSAGWRLDKSVRQ